METKDEEQAEQLHTFTYWFNKLPEPARSAALVNHNDLNTAKSQLCSSLAKAVGTGFIWSETSEGVVYWKSIHYLITQNKI